KSVPPPGDRASKVKSPRRTTLRQTRRVFAFRRRKREVVAGAPYGGVWLPITSMRPSRLSPAAVPSDATWGMPHVPLSERHVPERGAGGGDARPTEHQVRGAVAGGRRGDGEGGEGECAGEPACHL